MQSETIELMQEKLTYLEKKLILETDAGVKFKLEKEISLLKHEIEIKKSLSSSSQSEMRRDSINKRSGINITRINENSDLEKAMQLMSLVPTLLVCNSSDDHQSTICQINHPEIHFHTHEDDNLMEIEHFNHHDDDSFDDSNNDFNVLPDDDDD